MIKTKPILAKLPNVSAMLAELRKPVEETIDDAETMFQRTVKDFDHKPQFEKTIKEE